jgi:general secretion pathway protein B
MSFILDALKKSETDRQRQSMPALFEVKVAAPRRRFPLWAVGLAVLFGVNLLALLWVLLRPTSPSAPGLSSGDAPAIASVPAPGSNTPAAAPPGMITVPATVTIPTTVNIPVGSAPSVTMGAGDPDAGVVAPSNAPPLVEEPLLARGEPSVPPDYDATDYAPAITPAQANSAATRRSGAMPSYDEVLAEGMRLPEMRLDMHVYADNPADRFVFINMRKLREGETLPEGVRVDRITPRGTELSYQGRRFSLEGN